MFDRARYWSIDLTPKKNGNFSVQAKWVECRGDGCGAPDLFKGTFSTILVHSGDELRDLSDQPLNQGKLIFKPLADAQRQTYIVAKQFLERWVTMRATENLSEFAKQNVDLQIGVPLHEVIKMLERYRMLALGEAHAEFEIMEAYLLESGPDSMPVKPVLFLQLANRRSDGRRLLETFELTQDGGIWRLSSLRY